MDKFSNFVRERLIKFGSYKRWVRACFLRPGPVRNFFKGGPARPEPDSNF